MHVFRLSLVMVVILVLVNPAEAWRARRTFRRIGKHIKKVAKKIAKPVCSVVFSIGCPLAVGTAGAAIAGGTGGLGAAAAAVGGAVGKQACHTRSEKCKRSVPSAEILVPFSDEFNDYDNNRDKRISYEEFSYAIMRSLPMAAPEELRKPFMFADSDDDDYLDVYEFQGAPFLFAHEVRSMAIVDASSVTDHTEIPPAMDNSSIDAINITDTDIGMATNETFIPTA